MTTIWTDELKHPITYLLTEAGFYLLQENGDKLILEQTGTATALWTDQTIS